MTFASTTVTTPSGLDVEVLRGGRGIKAVAIHGRDTPASDDGFLAELAERFEVFVVVVPGSDQPSRLGAVSDAHELALVVDDVMGVLELTNVPVVGTGFGAMAAAELAAHARHRVAKLVLVAPVGVGDVPRPVGELAGVGSAELLEHYFASGLPGTVNFDQGLRRRLYRIVAPTRVVRGSEDPITTPADVALVASGIASCDVVEIAGGHLVAEEQPEAVVDAVEEHVRGQAPGANDGLLIRHIDDLEWHEVRVMNVDGVRSVVKNRFIDFGEHRTICHTWYDPGIMLARHSHLTEELIYVLSGSMYIDDVHCPEGTVVVLEPGTYFGPLSAGPEGAFLLEAFRGIGIRAGQDATGFEQRSAAAKVVPLPDPPFNPPVRP